MSMNKLPLDAKDIGVPGLTLSLSKEASCLGRANKRHGAAEVGPFLPALGESPCFLAVVGYLREGLQSPVVLGVKRERKGRCNACGSTKKGVGDNLLCQLPFNMCLPFYSSFLPQMRELRGAAVCKRGWELPRVRYPPAEK